MKNNRKGFTLAELLIVVAIIAVLVAIAIPIFTTQLEKSREATDVANLRDYYAEISVALLSGDLSDSGATGTSTTTRVGNNLEATVAGLSAASAAGNTFTVTVAGITPVQTTHNWQSGGQSVAGVAIADNTDMVGATNAVYTFTIGADLDAYLSGITFTNS